MLCGDIPAPDLFLDNILGKGSGTGIPAETQAIEKSLSDNSLGSPLCSAEVYNLVFSVFYHYGNMYTGKEWRLNVCPLS